MVMIHHKESKTQRKKAPAMKKATIITSCLFHFALLGWCLLQAAWSQQFQHHQVCSHLPGLDVAPPRACPPVPRLIPPSFVNSRTTGSESGSGSKSSSSSSFISSSSSSSFNINQTVIKSAAPWEPWSHEPHCFQPAHKPNMTAPYCLYSYPTFRTHGISLVTTPGLAAVLTGALDDGIVPRTQRDHASSPMAQHRRLSDPAYEIRHLPGRGKGVVATRPINRWETAMVQFPSLVLQMDLWEAVPSPKQSRRLLNRALRQLPDEEQQRIRALARTGELQSPVEDILRTNIFGIDLGGVLHMALFVEGSRVNHNCRPNVYWKYDVKTMAQEVVALRDIDAGEELTHSYVTLGGSRDQRRQELKAWGFECKCSLCSAPPPTVELSDQRRRRLNQVGTTLRDAEDLSPQRTARLVEEMGSLLVEEQLDPQVVVYYPLAARALLRAGDRTRARDFVALAEEAWVRFQGEEHENIDEIKQLWREVGS